jgi:hypothetical protein
VFVVKDIDLRRDVVGIQIERPPKPHAGFRPPAEALFQRDLALYEEVTDERGEPYPRPLGAASWVQTPGHRSREFFMTLDTSPRSDVLFLETQNGDNPRIELDQSRLFYPATRLLFKAGREDHVFLYYGNPEVGAPRYDLSLVADQLLTADKATASLAAPEQLRKPSWGEGRAPGTGGVLFWGILVLVVVVLLVIIGRLLPKSPPAETAGRETDK